MDDNRVYILNDGKESLDVSTLAELPEAEPESEPIDDDGLEYLKSARSDVDFKTIEEALNHIDPDISYPDWVTLAASIKHQFQNDPAKGFELFNAWSSRGSKYEDLESTEKQYNRLTANPDRTPATLGTVLFMAEKSGWKNPDKAEANTSLKAQLELVASIDDLESYMLKVSEADSQLTDTNREAIISLIIGKSKSLGSPLTRPFVKKKCSPPIKAESDSDKPVWLRGWVYIESTKEFFNITTREQLSSSAFDTRYTVELVNEEDLAEYKKLPVNIAIKYALYKNPIDRCKDIQYRPDKGDKIRCKNTGALYANSYKSCLPKPTPEKSEWAGKVLMDHLEWLTNSADEAEMVVDFLAYNIQHPGKKILWALFLQSEAEGAGKSVLVTLMRNILGAANVSTPGTNALNEDFNGWAEGSQLVFFDEVMSDKKTKMKTMNKFKELITEPTIGIRKMRCNVKEVVNVSNYGFFSNYLDGMYITFDTRRFYIILSPIQSNKQVKARMESGGFDDIWDLARNNSGAAYHYMLNKKPNKAFSPKYAVETGAKKIISQESLTALALEIREVIYRAPNGVSEQVLSSREVLVNLNQKAGNVAISNALRSLGYRKISNRTARPKLGGVLHTVWGLETLLDTLGADNLTKAFYSRYTESGETGNYTLGSIIEAPKSEDEDDSWID